MMLWNVECCCIQVTTTASSGVCVCYLDKDALGQEASQCVCVGGGAAGQADVELW